MLKTSLFPLIIVLFTLSVIHAQDTSFATHTPQPLPEITHVIVISIDGARPDAILQADTHIMQELARTGAVDWSAQTISPSVTIPAHTSLLTGLDPQVHGVTHNSYTTERLEQPTFISLAQDAGYRTAIVAGKEKFLLFHQNEDTYYEFVRTGDPGVSDKTIELLKDGYEVLFVHLPNTDFFGHLIGWMSNIYIYELRNTDANIGRIVDTLDELGIRESTLIIITADHGGHGQGHGLDIPEDMTIPLILNGAGIEPNTVLQDTGITQIASTVLLALEIEPTASMNQPLVLWQTEP